MNSPIPIVHKPTRCMFVSFRTRCARSAFVVRIVLFEVHGNTVAGRMSSPSGGDESASGVGAVLCIALPFSLPKSPCPRPSPQGTPAARPSPILRRRSSTNQSRAALRERCQA